MCGCGRKVEMQYQPIEQPDGRGPDGVKQVLALLLTNVVYIA